MAHAPGVYVLGDKGKMVADTTHKMVPSRWPHGLKDKGKTASGLFPKVVLPSWPRLGDKRKKDGRQKVPSKEGKSLQSSSSCRWRPAPECMASAPHAAFSCGMPLVLVLMCSLLQVCGAETGLLAPVLVGPARGTGSTFAADGICKVRSENSF